MPCYISFRDVTFSATLDTVTVTLTTDVASHTFLRLTDNPPWLHRRPVLKRGLQVLEDVRFCFTAYQDIEQDEAGDTLIHTFSAIPWPFCTTKYFYFWGSQDSEVCASTSPVLEYHNASTAPSFILEEWTWTIIPPPDWQQEVNEPWTS